MPDTQSDLNALGVASFAISLQPLTEIVKSGAIPKAMGQALIENVLGSLENLPIDQTDPAVMKARHLIEIYAGTMPK